MVDYETHVRAALKAELDRVEPSTVAWHVIRSGQHKTSRRSVVRPFTLGVATVAAVAAVTIVVALSTEPVSRVRPDTITPNVPKPAPGLVVDEVGDAPAPYLDLTSSRLRVQGDRLKVTWTVAGTIPSAPATVDFRLVLFDADKREPTVVVARLDGKTRAAGIGPCAPAKNGFADCAGRIFQGIADRPSVEGNTVMLTVPLSKLDASIERVRWTAYVQEVR